MIKRGIHFIEVAFFLARFGKINPPARLNTLSWKAAYQMFYEQLNEGREIVSFERSLKNARDAFDSHFGETEREGWKDKNGDPNILSGKSLEVYHRFIDLSEEEIWSMISEYATLDSIKYGEVFENLSAIQESEKETATSRTEGGVKVYISRRAERKPSLRIDAFRYHKYSCQVCGFNFGQFYGEWGADWAEVHHLTPVASHEGHEVQTDPATDLAIVCANCHRMIHKKKGITLTIDELKAKIEAAKNKNLK